MAEQEQFFEAVKGGEVERVQQLLAEDPGLLQARTDHGYSALMLAVYYSKNEVLDALLAHGPELDIFEAAATGRDEQVRELLETDPALVNAFAPDGFQPLGLACFFGHTQAARLLLEAGAEPNSPSQNAQHVAPLNSAAAGRHVQAARLLLERGADPNIRQAGSHTPLHSAAQNGDAEMARLLLDHGADRLAVNDAGQTPLEMAQGMGYTELEQMLGG